MRTKYPWKDLIRLGTLVLALPLAAFGAKFNGLAVAPTLQVSNRPRNVAIGDFNGDGLPDLAVVSTQNQNVSVLLGCVSGTTCVNGYLPAVNYHAPGAATTLTGIITADVNQDGKLDLVLSDGSSNDIAILLGKGDGTFVSGRCQGLATCPAGVDPVYIATGTFRENAKEVDVAVVNAASNTVSVYLGTGVSFMKAVNYNVGNSPTSVVVADFNGDGHQDLAVTNGADGTVTVLLGNGHGQFGLPKTTTVGALPISAVAADFNGDGKMDLAVDNAGSGNITVLFGTGTGSFSSPITLNAGTSPQAVAAGDLNGDGRADLVVADGAGDNVAVLLNTGGGNFQAPVFYVSGAKSDYVAVADVNRDNKADVIVVNRSDKPGGTTVLYGKGDGTLVSALNFPVGPIPESIVVGKLTCSNNFDFAVANSANDSVSISKGNGDGTFQTPQFFSVGDNPLSLVTADFNKDGVPDLAVANSSSDNVSVLIGSSNCSGYASAVNYPFDAGSNPVSIAAADFDGDGYTDLAVANLGTSTVGILQNNQDGTFTLVNTFSVGSSPDFIAVGDFNNDHSMDLAVVSQANNNVQIYLNSGNGTFTLKSTNCTGAVPCKGNPTAVAVADFNGDGNLDMAVSNYDDGKISVLFGAGDGTFGAPTTYVVGASPLFIAAAPLQGNNTQQDLIVADTGISSVSVLLNLQNKTGKFKAGNALTFNAGAGPSSIGVADFNGDGKLDLAIANEGGGNVTVLNQE